MEQTEKKKPIVPIVIGVVVVAVIGVVAFFLLTPKKQVTVPSIQYYYQAQAEKMLADAGLKLGEVKEEENQESYEGLILHQSPAADQTVDEGSTVDITIAKGLPIPSAVVVPDLKGMSPEEAEIALISACIFPLTEGSVNSDDVEPGKVCEQSEAAGTSLPISVEDFQNGNWPVVSYKTSLGKEQVAVPDVVGKTSKEARDAFAAAGLAVDTTQSYSDTVEADRIISQSVAKDTMVLKGTVVSIEISIGKRPVNRVYVPDIRTYSLDEAKRALDSAALKYTYSGDLGGRVITVSPAPGTQVDEGSTVNFTLQRTAEQIQQEEQERQRQEQERQEQERQEQERQEQERQEQERQEQERLERELREEEERQRQEQEQQIPEEPTQEYISEADAITAAVAASIDDPDDTSVRDVQCTLETGGDAPHYVVSYTTDTAVYTVTIDAITGEVWDVSAVA